MRVVINELVLVVLVWLWLSGGAFPQPQQAQVPCFFIFGDSLVDNGNNNGILTLARANYRPYGIDFPQGSTGRFTNGRTFVDVLGNIEAIHIKDSSFYYVLFIFYFFVIHLLCIRNCSTKSV